MDDSVRLVTFDGIDVGPCCACGATGPQVRNLVCLPYRVPAGGEGKGWGCMLCRLPAEGAIAVVCDGCLESGAEVREVVVGYALAAGRPGGRVPRSQVSIPYEHDYACHPEEWGEED